MHTAFSNTHYNAFSCCVVKKKEQRRRKNSRKKKLHAAHKILRYGNSYNGKCMLKPWANTILHWHYCCYCINVSVCLFPFSCFHMLPQSTPHVLENPNWFIVFSVLLRSSKGICYNCILFKYHDLIQVFTAQKSSIFKSVLNFHNNLLRLAELLNA